MEKEQGYTLFVGNNCCSCNKITQYISKNNIDIPAVNIDDEDYSLPFSLMIIPALVLDKKLIAYGPDIFSHIEKLKKAS